MEKIGHVDDLNARPWIPEEAQEAIQFISGDSIRHRLQNRKLIRGLIGEMAKTETKKKDGTDLHPKKLYDHVMMDIE